MITLHEGEEVYVVADDGLVLQWQEVAPNQLRVAAYGQQPPPEFGENLLQNIYFADYELGACRQCGIFPHWQQLAGTWRISQVKAAETNDMPPGTTTATEWDRDYSGDGTYNGWLPGQSDEMWQVVHPPAGYANIMFAFHTIHHVYGGDCVIGVDAQDTAGEWHRLDEWRLSTSGMPPATRYERIWRKVERSVPAPAFPHTALRLHLWAQMQNINDGQKISGMELRVG